MSNRDNLLLIEDMLEAALKIKKYTLGFTFEDFVEDDNTLDAVVRNFEVIGEASARIEPEFQMINSQIPWQKLRGYRNRLIHEYFGVYYQIFWDIISEELPDLMAELKKITGPNNPV